MFDVSKSILKSKTIIGIVVAAAPVVLNMFGFDAKPEDVQTAADSVIAILEKFSDVITLGGLAFAAYGRIFAKTSLNILPVAK